MPSISGDSAANDGGGRRLTAIAFVDIVGYSILMSEDEAGTHRRWMASSPTSSVPVPSGIGEELSNPPVTGVAVGDLGRCAGGVGRIAA